MDSTIIHTFAWHESIEILKYVFPVITLLIGLLAKHLYDKRQEKNKIKEIKSYFLFSIELLMTASKNQSDYIEEFNKQFATETRGLNPIRIEPSLQLRNLQAILPQDIFKIFVLKKRKDKTINAKIFNNYNLAFRIIDKVSNNLEKHMNDYIREDTEMSKQFNAFASANIKLLNDFISKRGLVSTPENEKTFTEQSIDLYDSFYHGEINNNIFEVMPGVFKPHLELAKKYKILEFINLIPSGLQLFDQYNFTRLHYSLIYKRFIEELGYAKDALLNVHSELR